MDDHQRDPGLFQLPLGTDFLHGIVQVLAHQQIQTRHDVFSVQAGQVFNMVEQYFPQVAEAAVINRTLHIGRQVITDGVHDHRTAKRGSQQHNFSLRIDLDDLADPGHQVVVLRPAHAGIFAFGKPARPQVRGQHVVAPPVGLIDEAQHVQGRAQIPVHRHEPPVILRIVAQQDGMQLQAVISFGKQFLMTGFRKPFGIALPAG